MFLSDFDPLLQSLLASLFTWAVTALGAAVVFISPSSSRVFLDGSLGFSSGVMLSASFWSLLSPAIEISKSQMAKLAFVPVAVGFALGALFVYLSDRLTQSLNGCVLSDQITLLNDWHYADQKNGIHSESASPDFGTVQQRLENAKSDAESSASLRHRYVKVPNLKGMTVDETIRVDGHQQQTDQSDQQQKQSLHRILMLIIAITAHNFPEGLAVGVGFGGAGQSESVSLEKASNLALSIGLQNFPEGMAVALPLAAFGHAKWKAFLYGQISGMVEPIAALIGASLVLSVQFVLPYALSFAAGAMVFVVFDSIIPEAHSHGNGKMCSLFCMVGFLVMMCLEIGS